MPITIDGTTGISGVDGSAGAPALIGSDADTGLVFAAGQVSASINGIAGNVPLVQETAKASTSGTNIDFTGIPSWVKRITVALNGVSTNGTASVLLQLGDSGGIETSGYSGSATVLGTGASTSTFTSGALVNMGTSDTATGVRHGIITFVNVSGNTWTFSGVVGMSNTSQSGIVGGSKTLSDVLTQLRVTTTGTDTFDAGTINILYE